MKLLLTSAGITNESILQAFFTLVGKRPVDIQIAFVPTAKNNRGAPIEQVMKNQIDQLVNASLHFVIVDPSFDEDWADKLDRVDAVVIGGGNTFHLLNEARKSGFDKWLLDNKDSKVYVGTSAGTILFTPNMAIASVDDGDENLVGITDLSGLGLVDFEISPHTPEDVSHAGNEAHNLSTPHKLLALDNQSAIVCTDDRQEIVSEGEWRWYD